MLQPDADHPLRLINRGGSPSFGHADRGTPRGGKPPPSSQPPLSNLTTTKARTRHTRQPLQAEGPPYPHRAGNYPFGGESGDRRGTTSPSTLSKAISTTWKGQKLGIIPAAKGRQRQRPNNCGLFNRAPGPWRRPGRQDVSLCRPPAFQTKKMARPSTGGLLQLPRDMSQAAGENH